MEAALKNKAMDTFKLKDFIWCLIIILYCSDFMGLGNFLPIILFPYILVYLLHNKFNKQFILVCSVLFSFCLLYTLMLFFYQFGTIEAILGRLLFPLCLLVIGYKLASDDYYYKKAIRYFYIVIFSFSLYAFFSLLNTILIYGSMEVYIGENGRSVLSIWDNSKVSATALNAFLSLGLALLPILFISGEKIKWSKCLKLLSLVIFSTSLFSVIQLLNRTGLVIVVLSFFVVLIFVERINGKKIINLLGITFFMMIMTFLYNLNLFGVKQSWEGGQLYARFASTDLSEDPRIEAWKTSFIGLFENPLGGKQTELNVSYAHNLWLDIGIDVGIFPFTLLIIFTLMSLISVVTLLRSNHPIFLKGLVIAIYTAFILSFAVEPILQGLTVYFTMFCFFFGIILRINTEYRLQKFIELKRAKSKAEVVNLLDEQ